MSWWSLVSPSKSKILFPRQRRDGAGRWSERSDEVSRRGAGDEIFLGLFRRKYHGVFVWFIPARSIPLPNAGQQVVIGYLRYAGEFPLFS